jgi:uncharacterized protein YciI
MPAIVGYSREPNLAQFSARNPVCPSDFRKLAFRPERLPPAEGNGILPAATGGSVSGLSPQETAVCGCFVGLHFTERYQTHIFGRDRAMTVEEAINELITPNIRKRLFVALRYPAASQEQMLPYVPEHLRYMEANEDKIFLSGPLIKEGQLVGEGLSVLRVDSEHDAHALMQAEPLIKHGVRRYELKVWEVRQGSLSFETKLSRAKLILS